jgi:hypothetical protein
MAMPQVIAECAFTSDPGASVPAYVDISSKVMSFTINRGRQTELDTVQASTLTMRLDNADRRFDPTYTLSPYYPYVLPMRLIRVSAVWAGTTYRLFTGYVERWPIVWDAPAWGSVTIQASDGMAGLAQARLAGTFTQEATGARIADVLTAALWGSATFVPSANYWTLGTSQLGTTTRLSYAGTPTTLLDAGRSQVQAVTLAVTDNVTALAHIQSIAAAERGIFFIDGQGRAVFHDRAHRWNTSSVLTFTDAPNKTPTRIGYTNLLPDIDAARVYNEITVTRTGGTAQTAVDGISQQRYFRRSLTLTPALLTDAEALDQASYELTLRKDARMRFLSVEIKPQADGNAWPHALGREISDQVTVERTPASIASITSQTIIRSCFIEAVTHTVDPQQWVTSFLLSPADLYSGFFTLGTAQLDNPLLAALAY